LLRPRPPTSTLCPYTTLFRSRVYVGSKDGYLYCLNASTGQKIWRHPTGSEVNSSPTISGGRAYFGSDDGWFYCLDAETGDPYWIDRKSTRLNSSHVKISYAVF